MHECQAVFHHRHHAQMGENPELRTLFHRLANLLGTFIIPIFIFDGMKRPSEKRGKKVPDKPHWLTNRFMEFIDAFGFYSHVVSLIVV
jgi:Holliday junction resolvase YEN1